ncbi:ankyrin, partial [Lepidopterella palustris CBS 459.81]
MGIPADTPDVTGATPFMLAMKEGHEDVAQLLIDMDECHESDRNNRLTALHWAVLHGMEKITDQLLTRGYEVDCRDSHGYTPLHLVASTGNMTIAKALLRHKADPGLRTNSQKTPTHIAAQGGNLGFIKLIFQEKPDLNPNLLDRDGRLPLHEAAWSGDRSTVCFLLSRRTTVKPDIFGWLPIHYSILGGNFDVFKLLHESDTDIHAVTKWKTAMIHLAAYMGRNKILEYLLCNGVDVNTKDNRGATPLIYAINGGQVDTADFLIRHNADLRATMIHGHTPIHETAKR